jgi:outer membrane protein W
MLNINNHKTAPYKYGAVLSVFLFFVTVSCFSQTGSNDNPNSNLSATVKMGGISPSIGITYHFSNKSKIRGLGFFTVNTSSSIVDQYLLDFSYIHNFRSSNTFNPYWGLNLNLQFNDLLIGPGILVGSSYNIDDKFSIFGEAGINAFIAEDSNTTTINLFNTGVGISVSL